MGHIGLPPLVGEWATAEPGLLQEAILRLLDANPKAWEMVFDRLDRRLSLTKQQSRQSRKSPS